MAKLAGCAKNLPRIMWALNHKTEYGFSLIELLLTMAIFLIIAGMAAPVAFKAYYANELNAAGQIYSQALRHASMFARTSKTDSTWGVFITSSQITLFNGISYALRSQGYDITSSISSQIDIGGTREFIFAKESGYPAGIGTTTLYFSGQTSTIFVNDKGAIFYIP